FAEMEVCLCPGPAGVLPLGLARQLHLAPQFLSQRLAKLDRFLPRDVLHGEPFRVQSLDSLLLFPLYSELTWLLAGQLPVLLLRHFDCAKVEWPSNLDLVLRFLIRPVSRDSTEVLAHKLLFRRRRTYAKRPGRNEHDD